ncbi:MAG TPA: DUF3667 domain-containing protein [Sphingomicrobium sp.]|jgi:cell division protein FtsB|nr:DUF3667 domain-containing protein [Sphingomicrobium sp.]
MGEFEALGDAVTGGVVGRAVEPAAGEATDGHTDEASCLNCGAALVGPYCFECGQHAHVHRTLSAFFHDLLHGVLHFEGKIWHTLPLLVWRPGELTRRYIDGQRARFVSPIALFLFCVFLTFAAMSLTGSIFKSEVVRQDIASDLRKDEAKITTLEAERAKLVSSGQPTTKVDRKLSDLRDEAAALTAIRDKDIPVQNLNLEGGGTPDWLVEALGKAKDNPELVFYKIKTNAYKFSWALIPISVPLVWMLFPFSRRFKLYDHTVFVTYSLSFMMLLLIASTLIGLVWSALASLAWFVPPVHMYRQLRGTYELGKWAAVWRTTALVVFAFIAISLFTSLLVGMGAFE